MNLPASVRVLAAFLMDPDRLKELVRDSPLPSKLVGPARGEEPGDEGDAQVQRLARKLGGQDPAVSAVRREDIDAVCRNVAFRHGRLGFAWSELIDLAGLDIAWRSGRPEVSSQQLLRWMTFQDLIEPESALLASLAAIFRQPGDDTEFEWGPTLHVADDAVQNVLKRGTFDLHVHSGGLRNFATTWHGLRSGAIEVEQIEALANAPEASTLVTAALAAASRLFDPRDSASRLAWERRQLFMAIQSLNPKQANDPINVLHESEDYQKRWIDVERVLAGRTLLWRQLRQPMFGGAPGLQYFQLTYFKRGKRSTGISHSVGRIARGASRDSRPLMQDLSDLCATDTQRGIEIRMSPLNWPADYLRFLNFWDEQRPPPALRVGFAMHVLRTLEQNNADLCARLDRETATYLLARHASSEVARRFARIDIAGPETHRSGVHFAPYLGLLLGKQERIDDLAWLRMNRHLKAVREDIDAMNGTGADEWLEIDEALLCSAAITPRLRASWHAGEDFGDVLAGLYEISVAIKSGLGEGDTIGHGLALVADPMGGDRRDHSGGIVEWRTALESYLWLYSLIASLEPTEWNSKFSFDFLQREIRALLRQANIKCEEIEPFRPVVEASLRLPLCAMHQPSAYSQQTLQLLREYRRPASRCLDGIDRTAAMERLAPAIKHAQQLLQEEIKDRKMSVELNPSSNWRIFSPSSLRDLPTIKLAEKMRDATTICTDDPGTFGISLEIEFALLALGLRERDNDNVEAILEECRDRGEKLFNSIFPI